MHYRINYSNYNQGNLFKINCLILVNRIYFHQFGIYNLLIIIAQIRIIKIIIFMKLIINLNYSLNNYNNSFNNYNNNNLNNYNNSLNNYNNSFNNYNN